MWVNATRGLAAVLSLLLIHTIFVRGFSWFYWLLLPDVSGQITIWVYYLNFYQLTVLLAFNLALAFVVLSSGRRLWKKFRQDHLPPYTGTPLSGDQLPVLQKEKRKYQLKPFKKSVVPGIVFILLVVSLVVVDRQFLITHRGVGSGLFQIVSGSFYGEILTSIVELPLDVFGSIGVTGSDDAQLITLLHVWIPSIPLAICFANLYAGVFIIFRNLLFPSSLHSGTYIRSNPE